jgi:hypothetical protein
MNPFDQFDIPGKLPFKGKPYIDDLGVNPMDENDVNIALGGNPFDQFDAPQSPEEPAVISPEASPLKNSKFKAFGKGMEDMTSFGFTDELRGFGRAVGTKVRGDERPFTELVNTGIGELRDEAKQAQKDHSGYYLGGQLTGAVVPAFLPGGQAVASRVATGNAGARILKSALATAIPSAVYGFGSGEGADNRLQVAAQTGAGGAAIGAGLGTVGALAGASLKGLQNARVGLSARNAEALQDAGSAIKSVSSNAYSKMRQIGAEFTPRSKANIVTSIDNALQADGPLNQGLHGSTMSVLSDLKEAAKKPGFSLEQLDQWRRLLGRVPQSAPEDARKARIAVEALDDVVNNLTAKDLSKGDQAAIDALNLGRAEYARYSKFDRISEVIKKADGDPNKIKSGLKSFLDNKKKTRGFTTEEIMALQNAARYTPGEGIIKALGKFGFDLGTSQTMGNTALPVLSGLAGAATTGGTGALIPVAGTAARQTQKLLARGKAEKLLQVIENGGAVSEKEIMKLPPSQAKKLLQTLRAIPRSAARIPAQQSAK